MNLNRTIINRPAWQWLETLAISALFLYLANRVNPGNPFGTGAGNFPWIWFAPVLLALRYGIMPGTAAVVIFLLAWYVELQGHTLITEEFPKLGFLGGAILTMVCGEYGSYWQIRMARLKELNTYHHERLEELSHKYYLLRLSHDKLEHTLISKPVSLRDTLAKLEQLIEKRIYHEELPEAATFLQLLQQNCQLSIAGLYLLRQDKIVETPVATLGMMGVPDSQDPLIRYCLEHETLVHINLPHLREQSPSRYLIAAPVKTIDNQKIGLLVVEQMPFYALTTEAMQLLIALLHYYADSIAAVQAAMPIREKIPACPTEFASNLLKLYRLKRDAKIDSSIVLLSVANQQRVEKIVSLIRANKRALDVVWPYTSQQQTYLFILLPQTGIDWADIFIKRILKHWSEQLPERDNTAVQVLDKFAIDAMPVPLMQNLLSKINHVQPEVILDLDLA